MKSTVILLATALVALLGLAGCKVSRETQDPVVHHIRLTPCCEPPPARPASEVIAVGLSGSTDSPVVAKAQSESFRQSIIEFAQHGGHVQVVLFAGQGQTPAVLVDSSLPGPDSPDKTARDASVSHLVDGSTQLVDQALGLAPRSPAVARLVDQARAQRQSDEAGVIGYAVDFVSDSPLVHEVTVVDDGLQNAGGVSAGDMLTEKPALLANKLSALIGVDARGVHIRFAGLANSKTDTGAGGDRERTLRLRVIWAAVCRHIHASCDATS